MKHRGWEAESWDWRAWIGLSAGPWGRFFGAGEVRIAILSLLADGPKHGYQLMKAMEDRSGGTYKASAGSVYPTLQQLEDEQLIVSERMEGRRVYSLTDAGREELTRNPEAARRIWDRAEDWFDRDPRSAPGEDWRTLLKTLFKTTGRAMKWAKRDAVREAQLRTLLNKFKEDVEELIRKS